MIIHSVPLPYLSGGALPARALQLKPMCIQFGIRYIEDGDEAASNVMMEVETFDSGWVDGKVWMEYRISLWFHFLYYPFTIFPINVILISNWIKMNRPFRFSCSSTQCNENANSKNEPSASGDGQTKRRDSNQDNKFPFCLPFYLMINIFIVLVG